MFFSKIVKSNISNKDDSIKFKFLGKIPERSWDIPSLISNFKIWLSDQIRIHFLAMKIKKPPKMDF